MRLKFRFIVLFIAFIFIGCYQTIDSPKSSNALDSPLLIEELEINKTANSTTNEKIDTTTKFGKNEKKIVDTILSLRDVKERADYIEKESKGTRKLSIKVYRTPGAKYFFVKAIEETSTNTFTHFTFFVYPDSFEIEYLNNENGNIISLNEWRKENLKETTNPH